MVARDRSAESNDEAAFTPPRSPLRVMNILEELAKEPLGLLLVQFCERLDLPKTSVLSLLRALEDASYVVKHNGVYQLGEAALRLSSLIAVSFPFPHSVHDQLVGLMNRCNETVMLATLSEDKEASVYVDKVECQRVMRFSGFIGARRPLYCTAAGKALLAFQSRTFIEDYLKNTKLKAYLPSTVANKSDLKHALGNVRAQGVAVAIEEFSEGIGAIAAPVFDGVGAVRASVSIAGPADRVSSMRKDYIREVCSTAREMSLLLGWKSELLGDPQATPGLREWR
jgi:DNA-binding IclR family transcriptional regulator